MAFYFLNFVTEIFTLNPIYEIFNFLAKSSVMSKMSLPDSRSQRYVSYFLRKVLDLGP